MSWPLGLVPGAPPYIYLCQPMRVIDGDTVDAVIDLGFHVGTMQRVRLADIDTPEVFGKGAEPAGQAASAFTGKWLLQAEKVYLHSNHFNGAGDKYGRCLGDFYRVVDGKPDPVSLSGALKAAGFEK